MRVRATVAGLAMAGALLPMGVSAADWHLNGSVTEEFTYDNNFRLDATNEETLWGFNTRPRLGLETHSPRTDLFMNGALTSTMPNLTFGNRFATAAVVSDIRNPTAITMS